MNFTWHRFQCLGLKLVYDVASGSLHQLDDAGWDILDEAERTETFDSESITSALSNKYPPEVIREVLFELKELVDSGNLGGEDEGLNFTPVLDADRPVKALCLHVAHVCNISCGYCFASAGSFGGRREIMSIETAKKSIDFLMRASKGRKHCEVDFFGGEPLLAWDVVTQTVDYGREVAARAGKVIKFTITTNGIALDNNKMEYLKENDIAVVLSLDGRQPVNDNMRQHLDRQHCPSVYEEIVPKYQRLVELLDGQGYYVRGTYTRYNLDFSEDVKHLVQLGFNQVSVEPVIASAEDEYSLRDEDIEKLSGEYEILAKWIIDETSQGNDINFFHFNLSLDRGPCVAKRVSGCGAGNEYFAVTPSGELYPCHQFVGREEFIVGDVDKGVIKHNVRDEFALCNLISKETCRNCWARYFCGGGCHANAHLHSGKLDVPHKFGCELQKKRIECSLAIQALK